MRLIDIPGIGPKIAFGWLLYAVNSWSSSVVWYLSRSAEPPWTRLTAYTLLRTVSWIILTWIVFAFLDRQPATRMTIGVALFQVAPLVLLGAIGDIVAASAAVAITEPWTRATFADTFMNRLPATFHESIMWIFIIASVGHGIRFHYARAENRLRDSQMATALAQAKLQTLSSRMQPHFLFNALNSIAALVRTDARGAETMISRLGDLLRAAMNAGGEEMIPVTEELKFVEQYLSIQQIRYADRMCVEINASADAHKRLVPRFILQPLVENAVKHGIEPLETPGRVLVHAGVRDGHLELVVRNDAPADGAPLGAREGLGLSHTRQRLELLYGTDQMFTIQRAGGMVEAKVVIP